MSSLEWRRAGVCAVRGTLIATALAAFFGCAARAPVQANEEVAADAPPEITVPVPAQVVDQGPDEAPVSEADRLHWKRWATWNTSGVYFRSPQEVREVAVEVLRSMGAVSSGLVEPEAEPARKTANMVVGVALTPVLIATWPAGIEMAKGTPGSADRAAWWPLRGFNTFPGKPYVRLVVQFEEVGRATRVSVRGLYEPAEEFVERMDSRLKQSPSTPE